MVTELLNILLPIYGCVGLGFALSRLGFSWDAKVISPLILQVALPLLVIHQFTRPEVASGSIIRMILAAILVVGVYPSIIADAFTAGVAPIVEALQQPSQLALR